MTVTSSNDRLASHAGETVIAVESLNVSFGSAESIKHVLRDISLELKAGEILGIVGESGSGKTTLLSTVLGLLPPEGRVDSGNIHFGSKDLLQMSAHERRSLRGSSLRLVPQRAMTSLNPVRTVIKQFQQFAKAAGKEKLTAEDLSVLLRRVGLALEPGQLKRYPHEFSGGQLQRMFIAASVLLGEPSVIFADEPTSTLDTTVRSQILELIRDLRNEVNISVVFVSHDLGVVAQVCDRVLVMYAGEIVENTDVNSLFENPQHPYTRALLGALAERHQPHEHLTAIPGKVSDSLKIESGCRFAPRCENAFGPCSTNRPVDQKVASSLVKCHLYNKETL